MPADRTIAKEKDPRPYLVNGTTRMVHSTESDRVECQPRSGDNVGYADDLEVMVGQGFMPCPACFPERYSSRE